MNKWSICVNWASMDRVRAQLKLKTSSDISQSNKIITMKTTMQCTVIQQRNAQAWYREYSMKTKAANVKMLKLSDNILQWPSTSAPMNHQRMQQVMLQGWIQHDALQLKEIGSTKNPNAQKHDANWTTYKYATIQQSCMQQVQGQNVQLQLQEWRSEQCNIKQQTNNGTAVHINKCAKAIWTSDSGNNQIKNQVEMNRCPICNMVEHWYKTQMNDNECNSEAKYGSKDIMAVNSKMISH